MALATTPINSTKPCNIISEVSALQKLEHFYSWEIRNFDERNYEYPITTFSIPLKMNFGEYQVQMKWAGSSAQFFVQIDWNLSTIHLLNDVYLEISGYSGSRKGLFCKSERLHQFDIHGDTVLVFSDHSKMLDKNSKHGIYDDLIINTLVPDTLIIDTKIVLSYNFSKKANVTTENSLLKDVSKMYNSDEFTDVTITIARKTFRVHKFVLISRSEVFKALFISKMVERQTNQIEIEDIEPKVFKELLRYMYTEKISDIANATLDLCLAADKYQLIGLKELCEREMQQNVDVKNVVSVFHYSDRLHNETLKKSAVHFIARNLDKFSDDDLESLYRNITFVKLLTGYYRVSISSKK